MRRPLLPRLVTACWLLVAATLEATAARAEPSATSGPLLATSSPPLGEHAVPANWEWAYWVSGGARLGPDLGPYAGISAELTHGVLRYRGLPGAIYRAPRLAQAELRLGPWVGAATRPSGGLVEGGLTIDWGATYHAPLGSLDARGGFGYGAFDDRHASYGVVTIAWGVRSALGRYAKGKTTPEPARKSLGMASVVRLFFTYRAALDGPFARELVIGVELSPTFLLPPHGGMKLLGGPPS